jgi:hypothetical protein
MSIQDQIAWLASAKKLFCLESRLTGEETVRTLWVSQEILEAVTPPYLQAQAVRLSEFREFLDSFLEGGEFSVANNPGCKPSDAMLARVRPVDEQFWDFRVTAPKPGIRAFGGFAEFDTFVALTWDYREAIDAEGFDGAVDQCRDEWRRLFGKEMPLRKVKLDEYLSNYYPV